jgi:hypothetical protein
MPTHGPAANSTDPTNCTTPVFCEPLEGVTITLSPMMIHDGIGTSCNLSRSARLPKEQVLIESSQSSISIEKEKKNSISLLLKYQ